MANQNATLVSLLLTGHRHTDVTVCNAMLEEHHSRSRSAVYSSLIAAILVVAVLWSVKPEVRLLGWLFSIGLLVALFQLGTRRLPALSGAALSLKSPHLLLHLIFAVALGLAWGIGGVLFFTERLEYEMFLAMVWCCIAVVGATAFSTFLAASQLFIICVLVPGLILLINANMLFYRLLGFAGIAFGAIALSFSLVTSRMGLRAFTLSYRNTELVTALQESNKELEHKNDALHYALAKIEEVAAKDELTGCFNRRFLMETLHREVAISTRDYRPFTLLLIDVDHFKVINDTHGHMAGDRVLAELANTLRLTMRSMDTLARFGGEEFACLLPETMLHDAGALADRIRHVISTLSFAVDGSRFSVTVSIGVAQWDINETIESVIQRADLALYKAKDAGRNCIALADSPPIVLDLITSY
jgi:diguanylate cyclase (GGDEF)-like protein